MIGAFLSPLGAKIGFGLSIGLLLVVGFLWLSLGAEKRHSAKLTTRLAEVTAAYEQFQASVKAQTEAARKADFANKVRVESEQRREGAEHDAEIRRRIELAVSRVRAGAAGSDRSGSGGSPVPGTPGAAGSPDGAGQPANVVLANDMICAENTEKALGWQSWWRSVQAIPR